ncbi:MAG: tryptophan synthase subunit alpha [Betaproteobacteria bacterium]|jgi:tryptophan synthase alpha chain|nr:MAG: tryptophan synthase subunit alpha [Betaproteobacteria bacterium]
MSRISATFQKLRSDNKKALIPFVTAGDPNGQLTSMIMHGLVEAGADIIELGVPFSDPMADGPTIQRSSERALEQGVGLRDVLQIVSRFRQTDQTTPIVLMGYANPIEAMGYSEFAHQAQVAGVDGVLVVDYPPEESRELTSRLKASGLDSIFLLAPTTLEARMDEVARTASGYVYYVSLKGVTGAKNLDLSEVAEKIPQIRAHVDLPIGVGFGIRDGKTARAVAELSDAVVIGSRLVEEIEQAAPQDVVARASALIREIRQALDRA